MPRKPTPPVAAKDLQGFKYFALVTPLLERLHAEGTACDKAGNRQLFFDQYAALLLLYFFNPILTSFNGLQQASALVKVQKVTGGPRVSKGSLREAQGVFAATRLEGRIADLAERVAPVTPPQEWAALKDLGAVEGSLLPACSRLAWALWLDDSHRAAKRHVPFEVLRCIPVKVTVTAGVDSETVQLRQTLTAARRFREQEEERTVLMSSGRGDGTKFTGFLVRLDQFLALKEGLPPAEERVEKDSPRFLRGLLGLN